MASVIFHRLARREYDAALQWYAQRSARAAQWFEAAVDATVQRILTAPNQAAVYARSYRWVRTRRFPYILYYRILDADHVLVVACAHARRRPGYWQRRTWP